MNRGTFILPRIEESKNKIFREVLKSVFTKVGFICTRGMYDDKTSLAPIKIWYQKWGQSYVCANIQQKDMYFLND